ncbi:hypothetical protein Tco_0033496 [Tanacetum coccineum]
MRTRSSSNLVGNSSSNPTTSNPKRRNRRHSNQRVEPFALEESPVVTMADQRTMEELLCAPTEGYAEAIVFDESFHEAWDRYKDLLHACPHHGFTELYQLDTFYNALNPADQDSLNSAAGGNLLERTKLTHAVNQQTSVVTTAMTAILKQFQATPPPASVKAVEAFCVTCGGPHPYYQCLAADGNTFLEYQDNIKGYVAAATEDERVEETLTDPEHGEYTIKVPPPQVQKAKPPSQRNFMIHQRDHRYPHIPYPSRMNQEKQKEKDEVQIHKFWRMFKQLHINISLAHALILIPKYQKMLKSLLSNKEKLIELVNTPLNENCSAVILKKLPEKLGDPGKFLIPCGFSELKCKALADLGIARDVFVPVGKFTLFLRTARALIDVHGEEMILRDGNERLILNMRNDTSSYSNEPHQESINMIDVYNVSHEEYREDLFATNHPSGNPTPILEPETKSSSSPTLISLEESDLIWEEFEAYLASDSFPPGNSNPSSLLPPFHNSLSGSTTSSSPSLPISETSDYFLEEFADELAHITFPPGNDDLPFDAESDLRELEYLLNHDPIKEMDSILEDSVDKNSPDDNLVDTISEMFTDEHALDYSSPPLWDDYDDNLFDLETVNDDTYDDPFDSKEEKIKDSKILIDELDLPGSSDFLPFPECDSVFYEDFSEVDALSLTNNEDNVFNPGILNHENLCEVTNCVTPEKNVKKATNASLILEDFNTSLYELPFHKEVLGLGALLSFSSENEEKVFNPGILTSKRVHTSLLPELSHRGTKAFKVIKILKSPMEIFSCSYGEDIRVLDVPCLHFYPP